MARKWKFPTGTFQDGYVVPQIPQIEMEKDLRRNDVEIDVLNGTTSNCNDPMSWKRLIGE